MPISSKVKINLLAIIVLILLISVIFLFYLDFRSSDRNFTFAMFDIGQGDAIFIESPTGTQILIDAGPPRKILGALSRVMSPFDRSIDAIIITNPDQDHIGGFADVLKTYKVGVLLEPGTFNESKTYRNLKEEIKNKRIPEVLARRGMRLNLGGGAVIDILLPDRDVSNWTTNDGSVVGKLTYGETEIMLMGDATKETEKIILAENSREALDSDILKVGHHGSKTSTSTEFVEAVSPEYALISAGRDNRYGHPHLGVLESLTASGAKIFRTDLNGTIVFKCVRMGQCETKPSRN
ncbi:MAG: ComEC/Rec2 family competence protein [Patescibacteria group bacterium]